MPKAPLAATAPATPDPVTAAGQASHPAPAEARVVVLTRQGCHLCTEALQTVRSQCEDHEYAAIDVDSDPQLRARYTDHVPVIWVDDRLVAYWTLPEDLLRDALAGRPVPVPPSL